MRNGYNMVAVALCVVFSVSIAGLVVYENRHDAYLMKVYERVMPAREAQRQEQERAKEELEARRDEVRQAYLDAVERYLPGMAFCGDSVMSDTGGGGMDFRSTVNSLVRSNVCNSPTIFVDVNKNAGVEEKYAKYLPIIFVGEEASLVDPANLVATIRRYIGNNERYIVIGPITGGRDERSYLEYVLAGEFGESFVNIRSYMSSTESGEGLSSLELEITKADRAAMNAGRIPPSLLKSDGVHLNENGTRLLAYLTYDRMEKRGYFEEIVAAKQKYDEFNETYS